jgi:hypothetical protein
MADKAGVKIAQIRNLLQIFRAPATEVIVDTVGKNSAAVSGIMPTGPTGAIRLLPYWL